MNINTPIYQCIKIRIVYTTLAHTTCSLHACITTWSMSSCHIYICMYVCMYIYIYIYSSIGLADHCFPSLAADYSIKYLYYTCTSPAHASYTHDKSSVATCYSCYCNSWSLAWGSSYFVWVATAQNKLHKETWLVYIAR